MSFKDNDNHTPVTANDTLEFMISFPVTIVL